MAPRHLRILCYLVLGALVIFVIRRREQAFFSERQRIEDLEARAELTETEVMEKRREIEATYEKWKGSQEEQAKIGRLPNGV